MHTVRQLSSVHGRLYLHESTPFAIVMGVSSSVGDEGKAEQVHSSSSKDAGLRKGGVGQGGMEIILFG